MKNPLVSIIITTKNEEAVIENLLKSLKTQTYKSTEIIVVDNNSSDRTKEIAKKYTSLVFDKGPERSAQRNFGSQKAKGKYVLFLDADMELMPLVVESCVKRIEEKNTGGLVIPEKSIGEGIWAKAKAFERSFYLGDYTIEAARFYDKELFMKIGGFDESITGPEDWEFSERMKRTHGIDRTSEYILHNEGKLSLTTLMRKKYYYGKKTSVYLKKAKHRTISPQTVFFLRKAFYRKWYRMVAHPILTIAMIWMLGCETLAGVFGMLNVKFVQK